MREAIALARRGMGRTSPNPPVGAVVYKGAVKVGAGFHRQAGHPHAEIYALKAAGSRARGATLYVSLEPCSTQGRTGPCSDAIIGCGVRRVVISARDPNPAHRGRGGAILKSAGIRVTEKVCEDAGMALVAPFAKYLSHHVPFTTLKLGTSIDGRIADASGRSKWITSEESRNVVQDMRRRVDAILVGSGTAVADDPALFSRTRGPGQNQVRIVVDSNGNLSPGARVFTDGNSERTVIATTCRCSKSRIAAYTDSGARVWLLPQDGGRVSLPALFRRLGKEDILHVLCEGGGELACSLLRRGLVDELIQFSAPIILGGTARPCVGGRGWNLSRAPRFNLAAHCKIGDDVLLHYVRDGAYGPSAIIGGTHVHGAC
jgi:diaminohydroxyphosphoribosylaminopyrimidine deaminase/5-amino-6-(5-phosphoribosylamino)uracil reductase